MTEIYTHKGIEVETKLAPDTLVRCSWARREPNLGYHDREWGTPLHDERALFEFLVLEGAQAGLSWETILNKRRAYRAAFSSNMRSK